MDTKRLKKHAVRLTASQRADLEGRFAGPLTLRRRNRIQVLLRSDAGETDADIADDLGITSNTSANIRRRFAAEGLESALAEKPRTGGPAKLDGRPKRSSSPWRAARSLRAGPSGPPGCSRVGCSSCGSSNRCPRTRSCGI